MALPRIKLPLGALALTLLILVPHFASPQTPIPPIPLLLSGDDQVYVGRFYWGSEQPYFRPCNSQDLYWMAPEARRLLSAVDYFRILGVSEETPIYMAFAGVVPDEVLEEGGERYRAGLHARYLLALRADIPRSCE